MEKASLNIAQTKEIPLTDRRMGLRGWKACSRPHLLGRILLFMSILFITSAELSSDVSSREVYMPIFNNKLSFKVPPIKRSLLLGAALYEDFEYSSTNSASDGAFCTVFNAGMNDASREVVFEIHVMDVLQEETDSSRFGGTSHERGRQSLGFSVFNNKNGDLLRSKKNLASGTSVIEVNPGDCNEFLICFINLVYDGSWSSIDTEKSVTIKMTYNDKLDPDMLLHLVNQMTPQVVKALNTVSDGLFQIVSDTTLLQMESDRRDINEATYSYLIVGFVSLMVAQLISNIIVTTYLIIKIKSNPSCHIKKKGL
ncbi:BAG_1a_G0018510.mRNA.1.CDS.1 [Saccharomyces cerevisiae]|nr:SX2_G0037200.mRNA.1.CDS.1 [Saccharomyces cerevisiae]CAI4474650.1 BAG_1a_G0018510.mRNA.1.CDS.1 [Saccharomyces cerevisiae]CAI7120089.1 BAG_1a_G0018510.mRNA.1.CDS.1 [Saccharomyces cerevisiae]